MNRVVFPRALSGQFRAPASKSHAHRLLICAALGHASVRVSCDTFSDDILATIDCLNAMGAKITHAGGTISVSPIFANGRPDGACQLYCKESGSTLRFLLPVVGALGLDAVFHMEGRLPERPLHPFDEVLIAHGMHIHQTGAELHVSGKLLAGSFALPGNVSSQYLSGLLFALPLLPGSSTLTITGALQSASYLAMTEDAVLNSGIRFPNRKMSFPSPEIRPAASRMGLQPKATGLAQPSFSAQVHCRKPAFLPPACRKPPARPTGPFWSFYQDSVQRFGRKMAACLSESHRSTASTLTRAQSRT